MRIGIVSAAVIASTLITAAASANEHVQQTHSELHADGTTSTAVTAVRDRAIDPPGSTHARLLGDGVVWTRNTGGAIVTTTGVSAIAGLASGTYLNPTIEVALAELDGDGTPSWSSPGTDLRAAAAANADVIAGADAVSGDIVVSKWTSASNVPDWFYTIKGVNHASQTTIVVSNDGSTIAVLVTAPTIGADLYVFDSSSNVPIGTYTATDGTTARNITITPDGKYIAFRVSAWAYVWDRDAATLREGLNTGAATDPIAISQDGQYIAFGFTTLIVREWSGSAYGFLWSRAISGNLLRQCAISADGGTLAASWGTFGGTDPFVEVHEPTNSTPLWTYDYPGSTGAFQDIGSAISITPDGAHFVVGSWGNEENTSPQIHLFERASSTPLLMVTTPGSMFDARITRTDGGTIYVAAGGKNVHANTFGSGGDIFCVRYGGSCPGDVDGDGAVGFSDLIDVLANWGPCPGCPQDVDGDGSVGFSDVIDLLANWGPC